MKGGIMELNEDVLKYACISEDGGESTESTDVAETVAEDVQETAGSGQAESEQSVEQAIEQMEIDGETFTKEQIKQFKQGYNSYSKQVNDFKALEASSKEATELYNYIKGNKALAEKLYEFDQELNDGTIKDKLPSAEKEALSTMQREMAVMKIDAELSKIKASDSSVDEMALLQIATEQKLNLDIAYKVWKADNFENSMKAKLSEQSKNITKSLQDAKASTRSLIKEETGDINDGRFGLSDMEIKFAKAMEMDLGEYAKWKK